MVYSGPSTGCGLCRKRRIKCDGGRPQCQRCIIYKAECPGYRDSDLRFLGEAKNPSSDAKTATPPRKRISKKETLAKKSISSATTSASGSTPASTTSRSLSDGSSSPDLGPTSGPLIQRGGTSVSLPEQVSNVWEDFSVSSFIHDWTIPETSSVLAIGALEFVRALQPECAPNSDFSLALKAASLASFANQHNAPDMMARARTNYGKALSALKTSLKDPVVATEDHVLASIVLLHIYESITADDNLGIGPHDAGLRMLLEMRGDEQFDTERGRSLARFVLGYLHARNVNEKRGPSLVMMRGFQQMGYPPEHPAMANREELRAVTALLAKLTPLFDADLTDPLVRAHVISLLQETASLDHNFTRWMSRLPPAWRKTEYRVLRDPLSDSETTIPQGGVVFVYSTPLIACYIGLYRIQYMVLHKIVLRMANRLGIDDWSIPASPGRPVVALDRARSLETLRRHNTETLASAPYAMGEIDEGGMRRRLSAGRAVGAFYLLWPLTHIALDVNSTPDQIADALQALSYMGNILGVRRGLRNAIETLPIQNFMSGPTSPTQPVTQQLVHRPVASMLQRSV